MAKTAAFERFRLGLVTWANETTSPNAGAGTAAAIGSWWQRNGTNPASPVEIFLKTGATDIGWTKQNVVNLDVFNVKQYGAIGNGVADDRVAITNAITAANAAGGGIVYFPPGSYAVSKGASNATFVLTDVNNIVFLGDGYASRILMSGSAAFSDWYCFRVMGGSHSLRWTNLRLDGSGVTDPDPAEQTHFINVEVDVPAGEPRDLEVRECYFDTIDGDGMRIQGEQVSRFIDDIRISHNAFDMPGCRSCIGCQRYTRDIQVTFNWMTGSDDNEIDFEPTGGAGTGDAGPERWIILGNHFDHGSKGTDTITFSGDTSNDMNRYSVLAYNTITNGGAISGLQISRCAIIGNVITVNSTTSAVNIIDLSRRVEGVEISANVLVNQVTNNNRGCVVLQQGGGISPSSDSICDNLCKVMSTAAGGGLAIATDGPRHLMSGNMCFVDSTVANTSVGLQNRSTIEASDTIVANGNFCVGTNTALTSGVRFTANPNPMRNASANDNFVRNSQNAVQWVTAGGGTLTDWRMAKGNHNSSGTADSIVVTGNVVGVSVEGAAGPGTQIDANGTVAGPTGVVVAPIGSLATNTGGSQASVLWTKGAGAGLSGGSSGWERVGPCEFEMGAASVGVGTTAVYFAPGGQDLAVPNAAEIQFAVPRAGTIRNMRLRCTAGVGGGNNTFTMRRNGANTGVAFTVANTATAGTVGGVNSCVAGDLISVNVTKTAVPGTPQTNVQLSFEMTG